MSFFSYLKDYLIVFLVSMLPVVELRGAIPIGVGMGLSLASTYIAAIIGNILPVPFIILFSKKILTYLSKREKVGPFFQKIIDRANRKAEKFGKYELLALFLFVAIPLPGTGAWTGSLIAALLQLRAVPAMLAVAAGVCCAGVIMLLASMGLLGALSAIV